MNTCVYVFLEGTFFISLDCTLWSRIVGSGGNTMFNILRNCPTVFQSGCTIFHSYQQLVRVAISPHPHQHLLVSVFFILAILMAAYMSFSWRKSIYWMFSDKSILAMVQLHAFDWRLPQKFGYCRGKKGIRKKREKEGLEEKSRRKIEKRQVVYTTQGKITSLVLSLVLSSSSL